MKDPARHGTTRPDGTAFPIVRDEQDWKQRLSDAEYEVLRLSGTESQYTGEYVDTKTKGVYRCRACGHELFSSDSKFDPHCGWPSFFAPLEGDSVVLFEDRALLSVCTEARCANCGSHLGHVFDGEGYRTPTDQRWCINSISIRLAPEAD